MSLPSRIAQSARTALEGLRDCWLYLVRHPKRGIAPRLPGAGLVEATAIGILVTAVVAASMVLLDPLTFGLRMSLPLSVIHFFERITELGLGGVVLWPIGLCLLAVLALKPHLAPMGQRVAAALAARLGFLFVSISSAGLVILVAKYLIGRARPYVVAQIGGPHAQFTFDWLALKANYASFPSGHSAVVFSTAVACGALFPRARWPLMLLAFLVASSRVVLGSHYPSDVLAAGAVAALVVLLVMKAFAARRIVFSVSADGSISPKPGPSPRRLARLAAPVAPAGALEEARS